MEKYVLVEYSNTLNDVLGETFKSTQRIKLTSFDVSNNYILFGASSGGIYIFKRLPCEFIKLIPSKEGSTVQIKISPDERNLAIASSKGLVVILEKFFIDLIIRPLVHSEHEGNIVTVLEWQGFDLYCGDNAGKVSGFTVSSLLTKAIFQTPSTVLMHLDSSIVQIDIYLNYLLISTKTRTYLCDTEREQYKQIGKKLRDGNFGACFCHISNSEQVNTLRLARGVFRTVQDDEEFTSSLEDNDTKIFCARPGARLWEANFEASVLITYQFRNSLNKKCCDTLLIEDGLDEKLKFTSCNDGEEITKHFNFSKIYPICKRFIFTYDNEGIYFFDPVTNNLILWNNTLKNILDIKISNNCIFLWRKNLQITIISVQLLEDIIVSTLIDKQYYLCSDLCLHFIEDLLTLIAKQSKKLSLVIALKDKLTELKATGILSQMAPIFTALERNYKEYTLTKRLDNGIFVVDNKYSTVGDESEAYLPESVKNFEDRKDEDNIPINYNANLKLVPLYKQYILNKTHKNAKLTECSRLLEETNIDEALLLLEDFIKYVKETDNDDDATKWCQEQLIKQAAKGTFDIQKIQTKTLVFLSDSFLNIFGTKEFSCKCNFPLPKAHLYKLDYYNLAVKLLDHLENKCDYLDNIPYLYKHYLRKVNNLQDMIINLSPLTQFSDKDLFKEFLNVFTYDTWDEIIKLYVKLKNGICLNCEQSIDTKGILTWSDLGLLIIESVGPKNGCKLLKRYSKYILKGELDSRYYQSCMMVMIYEEPSLAVNFMDKFVNPNSSQKLDDMLAKFLQRKYLGAEENILPGASETTKCSLCKLPVRLILTDFKKCDCGIYFHSICFNETNKICNNCIKNSSFLMYK